MKIYTPSNHLAFFLAVSLFGLLVALPLGNADSKKPAAEIVVTEAMVQSAVQGWCDGLLKISKTAMDGGDAKAVASEILTTAYNYADGGKVLFKPTLTFGKQTFRLDKEGALAYFVGGNPNYPDDSGFALKKWVKAEFDVAGIITEGNIGIYMGNVTLTDVNANKVTVDKTFVFKFIPRGSPAAPAPVIIAHKSALPFTP
jgi:hypothetical protein